MYISVYNNMFFQGKKVKANTNYPDLKFFNLNLLLCLHLAKISDRLFKLLLLSAISIIVFSVVHKSHFLDPRLFIDALASIFHVMLG